MRHNLILLGEVFRKPVLYCRKKGQIQLKQAIVAFVHSALFTFWISILGTQNILDEDKDQHSKNERT